MLRDPADHPITVNESMTTVTFPAKSLFARGVFRAQTWPFRGRALLDIGGFDPVFGTGRAVPSC